MLSRLDEIEELFHFPTASGHLERAHSLAMSIACSTPNGGIVDLAMLVISAIDVMKRSTAPQADEEALNKALWRLRRALQEAARADVRQL
jgi:hypothetical protein